jgi:hypothetical protein
LGGHFQDMGKLWSLLSERWSPDSRTAKLQSPPPPPYLTVAPVACAASVYEPILRIYPCPAGVVTFRTWGSCGVCCRRDGVRIRGPPRNSTTQTAPQLPHVLKVTTQPFLVIPLRPPRVTALVPNSIAIAVGEMESGFEDRQGIRLLKLCLYERCPLGKDRFNFPMS